MTLVTTSGSMVYGDWRAGAYGGNRRAHRFDWVSFSANKKAPVCGARGGDKYTRVQKRDLKDLCADCLGWSR